MIRNELFDAAVDECRKAGVPYRVTHCPGTRHIMFFVANSPRIVVVGGAHRTGDIRAAKNVRRDIRHSIALIERKGTC